MAPTLSSADLEGALACGCACPHHIQVERLRVDVETCSPLSAGQTVVDVWHQSLRPKNCTVCRVSE